jgi:hypothetical protein
VFNSTVLSQGYSSGANWLPYSDGNFYIRAPIVYLDYSLRVGSGGDVRAPIFYDSNDTAYYVNPNSTSVLSKISTGTGDAIYIGGQNVTSSAALRIQWNTDSDLSYQIGKRAGAWVQPMDIAFYTGIRYHAAAGYGGHKFYTNGYDSVLSFSVGDGDNNVRVINNLYASVLYDYNNTAFYADLAGTTNINTLTGNGKDVLVTNDSYLRINQTVAFTSGIWCGASNRLGATAYFAAGSNGGTTDSRVWIYGGTHNGTNVISLNGSDGVISAAGDMRAPIFYDRDDTTFYVNLNGYSQINGAGSVNSSATAGLSIYSTGGSGAIMSYHRGGYFAINLGLDSDNVIRWGGWSASSNRLQMDMSGNLTMAGNVTAYSDIRIKTDILVIENALEKVSKIRGVTFVRTDEGSSDARQAGVIAQEVELVLPEVVSEDNLGIKNVAYGNMAGLFIEAIKELKAEIEELKSRIH